MGDTECGVLVVEGGVLVVDLDLERDDLLSQLSHLACLPETLKSQCPITSTGHGVSVLQSQTRSRVFKVRHGVKCSPKSVPYYIYWIKSLESTFENGRFRV